MPARKNIPPLSVLDETFHLDHTTGLLTYKARTQSGRLDRRFNTRHAGKQAGGSFRNNGYAHVSVNGKRYAAHRIVYAMHYREIPPIHLEVDHINRNRDDNRPLNLRLVTPRTNSRNTITRTDLPKGVCLHKSTGKFQASIRYHIGTFETVKEAEDAYNKIEALLVAIGDPDAA